MLDRLYAIRSIGAKTLLGGVLVSTLALAACGGTTGTGTGSGSATQNASLTACKATVSDLKNTSGSGSMGTAPNYHVSGQITADGSSALQPLIKQAAAEFDQTNGTHSSINAGGSGKGLTDVNNGAVQIGMSDLFQADKNISGLTDHQVAVVAFTLVVSSDMSNKVQNLTTQQIKDIYTGVDTNWSQLGGPNEAITVVNRPTNSGTRGTFESYVLGSKNEVPGNTLTQDNTGAVFQAVTSTPGSIGYVATGFVTTSQASGAPSPICIDGYKADAQDINSGNYKFWNIEHAYTKGPATGAAKALLQYVESDQVQNNDVPALNYYKVSAISQSAVQSHLEAGSPPPESFYPNS
jgi:phosphate transport system substrate-binding protein